MLSNDVEALKMQHKVIIYQHLSWVAGNEVIVKNVNANKPVFIVASSAFLGFPLLPWLSSIHCFNFVVALFSFSAKARLASFAFLWFRGLFAFTFLTITSFPATHAFICRFLQCS